MSLLTALKTLELLKAFNKKNNDPKLNKQTLQYFLDLTQALVELKTVVEKLNKMLAPYLLKSDVLINEAVALNELKKFQTYQNEPATSIKKQKGSKRGKR